MSDLVSMISMGWVERRTSRKNRLVEAPFSQYDKIALPPPPAPSFPPSFLAILESSQPTKTIALLSQAKRIDKMHLTHFLLELQNTQCN